MLERLRSLRKPRAQAPAPAQEKTSPLDSALARLGLPGVLIRQGISDFMALRPWWPVLIPLLIWVAMRTYRRERELFLIERSILKSTAQKDLS